ncbi:unnamed protein product [Effrenium voratum]|uniref:P-type ATPase A domain-containing protein n=1 Tax=Effrenium voratum TaxID=2562239 RepID=A0AA36JAW7_9DINO|nr:unnamed protein product [Effrenium voratum]CAJ1433955.1 unnamed protein product [Effrenium voratum]
MPGPVAQGDGAGIVAPMMLLDRLCSNYKAHMAQLEKEKQQIFENKIRFARRDATTQLLFGVCDKLLRDKAALEEHRFEEHTAEPHVLFNRLGVDFPRRTSEKTTGLLMGLPRRLSGVHQRVLRRSSLRSIFGPCFGRPTGGEFPQNLRGWQEAQTVFNPTFEVLRDRSFANVPATELSVGDIVYLQRGHRAPCDLRVLISSEDTQIDASSVSMTPCDVRHCTTHCTALDPKASSNIVLKGSWVLQGSLLGIVLRPSQDPHAPGAAKEEADFVLDTSVPLGMRQAKCQSTYATLSVQASCLCRSFESMVELSEVQALIIFLTEDLADVAAVRDLVRSMRELGKAVFLVGDGQLLRRCSHECNLRYVALQGLRSANSTGIPSPSMDSTQSGNFESPGDGARSAGMTEDDCLAEVVASCTEERASGACISGISEAALARLCRLLQDGGMGVLYASSQLQPQFLRSIPNHSSRPRISEVVSACSTSASRVRSQSNDTSVAHWPSANTQEVCINGTKTSETVEGEEMGPMMSKALSPLVVSINSKGVLSDFASVAIQRSDLRCLALALQIVSKAVPRGC